LRSEVSYQFFVRFGHAFDFAHPGQKQAVLVSVHGDIVREKKPAFFVIELKDGCDFAYPHVGYGIVIEANFHGRIHGF
jgi:hypothetical protein